jgi:hypothetical protein
MGAYYFAYNETDNKCICSSGGLKLLEHAFINNPFVSAVMIALAGGMDEKIPNWKNKELVWLCDYNDSFNVEWYAVPEEKIIKPSKKDIEKINQCYILNHTKKEYVSMKEFKLIHDEIKINDKDGVIEVYHPLPLLTKSDKEYMGGGDYKPENNDELVGYWCGDVISVENEPPLDYKNITNKAIFKKDYSLISL